MGTNAAGDNQACINQEPSSFIEDMSGATTPVSLNRRRKKPGWIIWPLVPLRAALFLIFGGFGCLLIFLPLHMREVGLSMEHTHLVSWIAPLVSFLGPIVIGTSADRLGKHKVLLTSCLLLGAACYCLLLAVPISTTQGTSFHQESLLSRAPAVRLRCDLQGATIMQERCSPLCPAWGEQQNWEIKVQDCRIDCPDGHKLTSTNSTDEDKEDVSYEVVEPDYEEIELMENSKENAQIQPHPYLCFTNNTSSDNSSSGRLCHVFTQSTQALVLNASLAEVASTEAECHYPLNYVRLQFGNYTFTSLQCRGAENCHVYCKLSGKLWEETSDGYCPSAAPHTDPRITFWSYLLARSVADIFPVAVLPLLDTVVVVLARDHHSNVGRELGWGALGAGIVVPLVCAVVNANISPWSETPSALPILIFAVMSLLAAAALSGVKLKPAWYSRRLEIGGRPAYRVVHTGEAVALVLVLAILGLFWGALDTYLPWFLAANGSSIIVIGLTVTIGTVLAFPLLWNSERLIEYCGHTNLFIVAFAFYIIRFTGFGFMDSAWLGIVFEVFEIFTLCIMWVSAVVYTRHLVAQHLTATGQSVIVLAHFCLGRCLGALIGGMTLEKAGAWQLYQACALAAALFGWFYFSLYHCCMRPRCGRKKPAASSTSPDGAISNGSYRPLQIYNGGQKRERRY